jgi:excisionase family DNA binding protein
MTLIQILESRGEALTVQEVAELLGVSDKHIYEMVADGTLPAFYVGRSVRLDPQDIADWLRKRKLPVVQGREMRPQKRRVLNRNGHGSGSSAVHNALRRKIQHLEAAAVIDGSKTAEKS